MAEHFCLRWNNFQSNIVSALDSLKTSEDLVDVTLTCEGKSIKAHKVILSACSPYFRSVFKDNPCQHPIIILKDVLAEDILNLLSYMYQGEVFIEESKLSSFLNTAALLQIKGLCGETNQKNILVESPLTQSLRHTCNQITISPKFPSKEVPTGSLSKRRRNSATDTFSDATFRDHNKRSKSGLYDNDLLPTAAEQASKQADEVNGVKSTILDDQKNLQSKKSEGTVTCAIKHELEEELEDPGLLEEDGLQSKESPSDAVDAETSQVSQVLPHPQYENSMLARSLLSGAQSLKSESVISTSASKLKLHKGEVSLSQASHIPTLKKIILYKNTTLISEEQVKAERLSADEENLDHEPEVVLSCPSTSQSVLQSQMQSNHAAICGDCPHCGTKYSNQSALKYHVRLMHSDLTNRLCCYLCPRSFTMREMFKEHMWTTHGQRN